MTLIAYLLEQDDETLARIWVDFNRWLWPEDLPIRYKPTWWDGAVVGPGATHDRRFGFSQPFMDHIHATVPDDVVQRAWMARAGKPRSTTP